MQPCKKHTSHKVTQYKTGKASMYAQVCLVSRVWVRAHAYAQSHLPSTTLILQGLAVHVHAIAWCVQRQLEKFSSLSPLPAPTPTPPTNTG